MTILEKIVTHKKKEVAELKSKNRISRLEKSRYFARTPLSLADFIVNPDKTGIIAEFKRKSPSRGIINDHVTIEEVTTGYFRSGASALSILTDQEFFGGSAADLVRTRGLVPIPILRKEFIIDEYQVIESKSIGADAILLIAAMLKPADVRSLASLARSLGLEVLLEVHKAEELACLNEYVNMVGVNNRDLDNFRVNTELSVEMAGEIPTGFLKISESGITSPFTIKRLKGCGYQGFLIGESFMRTPEPAAAFSDFVKLLMFENA